MIGKVKEITIQGAVLEFKDGSTKLISFSLLPNDIIIDDLIILDNLETIPNEKYVDYF